MRPPFRMETGATTHRPRFFLGAPRPTYLRSGESFQRSLQSFRLGRLFGMILPRLGDGLRLGLFDEARIGKTTGQRIPFLLRAGKRLGEPRLLRFDEIGRAHV